MYKLPIETAKLIAKCDPDKEMSSDNGSTRSIIAGVIRGYNHDHPESAVSDTAIRSLSKRIEAQIRAEFVRLHADREILNWLGDHRKDMIELADYPVLRIGAANRMLTKNENKK